MKNLGLETLIDTAREPSMSETPSPSFRAANGESKVRTALMQAQDGITIYLVFIQIMLLFRMVLYSYRVFFFTLEISSYAFFASSKESHARGNKPLLTNSVIFISNDHTVVRFNQCNRGNIICIKCKI